jgi:hypothetical protein
MLDDVQKALPTHKNDDNSYTVQAEAIIDPAEITLIRN